MEWLDLAKVGAQLLIAAAGFMIAWRRHVATQYSTLRELHELFWTDKEMKEVRAWLSCAQAFNEVRPVFEKRRQIDEGNVTDLELTPEEYQEIEKLDRFLNYLQRLQAVSPKLFSPKKFWESLNFSYWLHQFRRSDRTAISWYAQTCYPDLMKLHTKFQPPRSFLNRDNPSS